MVVDAKTEMLRERLDKLELRERELADRVEDLETELERRDPAEVMLRQWEERRDWVWQQMRVYEQTIGSARGCGAVHVDPDWVSTEGKWRARRIELLNFVLDVEAAVRSLKECTAEDLGLDRGAHIAEPGHMACRAFRLMYWGVPKRSRDFPRAEWCVGSIGKALRVSYEIVARLLARSVDIVWARLSDYRGGDWEEKERVFTTEDTEGTE